ncbi:MAG: rod shape-determining protein RodA [Cyclobacteriaceae bacterium]|nr:rod shape-determining protein RodA [Cyclobacteriaceae bacterium]
MRRSEEIFHGIDYFTVIIYLLLVLFGWLNIYAAVYDADSATSLFDLSTNAGKQALFIGVSIIIIILIMAVDLQIFETLSFIFYGLAILLLIAVLFLARDINGAKSWLEVGGMRFQPSEFAKLGTALVIAKYVSKPEFKIQKFRDLAIAIILFMIPVTLIIIQKDMGTAIVFFSFLIVLYREGMTPVPLVIGFLLIVIFTTTILVDNLSLMIGIGFVTVVAVLYFRKSLKKILISLLVGGLMLLVVYSVDWLLNEVLSRHQKDRIELVFNPNSDPLGKGWNITQSKIAIGSGGFMGKGYLKGTQTKFDFVPEQSTDFIFCTIGEEHGFIGSIFVISVFVFLILRIIALAERQKFRFARIYGYSVASIFLVHFMINIGMTMGLLPVIGIPLPFFSYGGSSLLSFTILLFIFLKMDAHRNQVLDR